MYIYLFMYWMHNINLSVYWPSYFHSFSHQAVPFLPIKLIKYNGLNYSNNTFQCCRWRANSHICLFFTVSEGLHAANILEGGKIGQSDTINADRYIDYCDKKRAF